MSPLYALFYSLKDFKICKMSSDCRILVLRIRIRILLFTLFLETLDRRNLTVFMKSRSRHKLLSISSIILHYFGLSLPFSKRCDSGLINTLLILLLGNKNFNKFSSISGSWADLKSFVMLILSSACKSRFSPFIPCNKS